LAGAGRQGVERALTNMHSELTRDMKLMGAQSLADLGRQNLRFR
jgi:L-lactate dehydrogenase (cytochrome)